jgi:GTP 3',8-cyclase
MPNVGSEMMSDLLTTSQTDPFRVRRPRLLRLSVTDRCNFRCRYCMPPEGVPNVPHADILPMEELRGLVAWLSEHSGIERIKLTGGEPLVRKGIEHLIALLVDTERINEVSMTTNGSLLQGMASALKASGLSRVNVSLDSMDVSRFAQLTQGGRLSDTLRGIDQALAAGLTPLKLNAVLQRSSWKKDVPLLLDYAAANHLELRFIELMRTGTERSWCESEFVAVEEVKRWLEERGPIAPISTPRGVPARGSMVWWQGRAVSVGWIAPCSHPFCSSCERLRLDSRGFLRRCLMDSSTLDLSAISRMPSTNDAVQAFNAYLEGKSAPYAMGSTTSMSLIGG